MSDQLEVIHDGRRAIVRKQPVHQWRTDLLLELDGREYKIGQLEGGMTRGDVKRLAREWLERPARSGR